MPSSHRIKSLNIKDGFLDGTTIHFSDNLNCIIGGRGTGKTTVLEFIRYVLNLRDEGYLSPKRINELEKLIQANLENGHLDIDLQTKSDVHYSAKRKSGEDKNLIFDEKGNPLQISFGRNQVFDAEIFSQNDIENAAVDPDSQIKILDQFQESNLAEIEREINELLQKLVTNYTGILGYERQLAGFEDDQGEIAGIEEKLKAIKIETGDDDSELSGLEKNMQFFQREIQTTGNLSDLLSKASVDIDEWFRNLTRNLSDSFPRAILNGPHKELFENLQEARDESMAKVERHIQDIYELLDNYRREIDQAALSIESDQSSTQNDLNEVLARHQEVRGQMEERNKLVKQLQALVTRRDQQQEQLDSLKNLRDEHLKLTDSLSELRDRRFAIRQEIADYLNERLNPMIRISIVPQGNMETYKARLLEAMKGSKIQYSRMVDKIVQQVSPMEFAHLVQNGQVEELQHRLDIDRDRANKLVVQLQNTQEIFDIEAVEVNDRPVIELLDGKQYKDTTSLSTGQKCTAILPILLLESEKPLIIDQPEDNLDNAFVYETVVKSIREAKKTRQLIFVTHNPNVPVLGDAEKVFVMRSDGKHGSIVTEGNVDEVKNEIETILEGGAEAFEERRKRYGH